jgi:hypothetical protein
MWIRTSTKDQAWGESPSGYEPSRSEVMPKRRLLRHCVFSLACVVKARHIVMDPFSRKWCRYGPDDCRSHEGSDEEPIVSLRKTR